MNDIKIPRADDAIDRISFMASQADETIPDYRYDRTLSEDELAEEKDTYIDLSVKLSNLEYQKAEAMAEFNRQIKTAKQAAEKSLGLIRTGRMEVVENVYQIADFDAGKVGIYNQFGTLITARPFTATERKAYKRSVFNDNSLTIKTGTNE